MEDYRSGVLKSGKNRKSVKNRISDKTDKITRVLQIYAKLLDGCIINKEEESLTYGVNERSIQRDIEDIRHFLDIEMERTGVINNVIYDRECRGYRMVKI